VSRKRREVSGVKLAGTSCAFGTQVQEPGPPTDVASERFYPVPSQSVTHKTLDAICVSVKFVGNNKGVALGWENLGPFGAGNRTNEAGSFRERPLHIFHPQS